MNRSALILGSSIIALTASAHAAQWKMNPAASRLGFRASYENEAAPGAFKQFDTRLRFDPARPADGKLDVTVRLDSVDMNSTEINDAIREPDWFDLKRFPQAEFHSQEIRQTAPGRYVARGTLSLKGSQQQVAVPFAWDGNGKTATMAGEVTLNRGAFGIGTGEWASGNIIGLDVKVSFDVRLQRVD